MRLFRQKDYREAEGLGRQVVQNREDVLGKDAKSLYYQQKYQEAEDLFRQAVQAQEKVLGKENPETLSTKHWLAETLYYQQKYREAKELFRQVLQGREKLLGKEHDDTLSSKHRLAETLCEQQEYQEAEELFQQVLQGWEKMLGKEDLNTLSTKHWLAQTLYYQQKYQESEDLFCQVLQVREKVLGKEHDDTLSSKHWLAQTLCEQQKYLETEKLFRQVLQGREKVLGKEHVNMLSTKHWLAETLYYQQKYLEAEELFRQMLQGREKVLGKEHAHMLSSKHRLAETLYEQQKYEKAEVLFRQVHREAEDLFQQMQVRESVLGRDHVNTLSTKHWLAQTLYYQQKYEEAEGFFRQAFQGRKKVLGEEHVNTLSSKHWLAQSLYYQHHNQKAEDLFREVLKVREKVVGMEHLNTLSTKHWLAQTLYHQKDYQKAEDLFHQALQGREKVLGKEHVNTLLTKQWLAETLYHQKKYREAEDLFRQALQGREKVLGKKHINTRSSKQWLEETISQHEYYENQSDERICIPARRIESGGWVTLSQLKLDANEGCNRCWALWQGLQLCLPTSELTADGLLKWRGSNWFEPIWSINGISEDQKIRALEFFTRPGSMRFENAPVFSLKANVAAADCFENIATWMQTCGNEHQRCGPYRMNYLPRRIIEVGENYNPNFKLRTSDTEEKGLYACLSHRWGAQSASTLKLTTQNYDRLVNNYVPLETLPKTYADAVMIARELQIPYLWIDSMCIMQDDNEDWVHESSMMAHIFQNCVLTIAATTASSSFDGCFLDAPSNQETHRLEIPPNGPYVRSIEIFVSQRTRHLKSSRGHRLSATASNASLPLLERGWVYQERLLSPRVIHFIGKDVIWECNSSTKCLCESGPLTELFSDDGSPKIDHSTSFLFRAEELHLRWQSVVEEYSRLLLTFPTDRLPALSGLAKRFAEANGDTYLAGLWANTAITDLLWHVISTPTARPVKFQAPTWSWASVTGAVSYSLVPKEEAMFSSLATAQFQPEEHTFMGESSSPDLILTGHMISTESRWGGRSLSSMNDTMWFNFYPDVRLADMMMPEGLESKEIFCLRLGRIETKVPMEYFLVLRRIDTISQVYERIGLAEFSSREMLASVTHVYGQSKVIIR